MNNYQKFSIWGRSIVKSNSQGYPIHNLVTKNLNPKKKAQSKFPVKRKESNFL